MRTTAFFAATVAVLVLVIASPAPAQDYKIKPDTARLKTDTTMKWKTTDTARGQLRETAGLVTVSCDPACGFRITSHDEAEITSMVKLHSRNQHQKDLTDTEIRAMMKPAVKLRDDMKGGQPKKY